jgi:hypothetical protein
MSLARWEERLAPLDGIVAVGFWVAGVLVLQGPANQPDMDAPPARALLFFTAEANAILVGTFLYMIGTLFFLWFLGLVRTRLVEAEGGSHRLSSISFAGGVAAAISLLAMPAVHATGAINNDNLSADAAQVYLGINIAFFYAAEFATAVFLLALGLVTLRGQPFPRWLGTVSIVYAVILVIPPIGWAVLLWGFPLWLIVVSLILWTRSRSDSRPGPEHRTP